MKSFQIVCAALVVLAASAVSASAADRAISKSTLASMGLSSMQTLSDNDGLAIRGKGTYANVWGSGTAILFGSGQTSGYNAGAAHNHGSSLAVGGNVNVVGFGGSIGNLSGFVIGGTLGASGAYAK